MVKVLPTPFLFLKYKFSACLPHILKTEIFFFLNSSWLVSSAAVFLCSPICLFQMNIKLTMKPGLSLSPTISPSWLGSKWIPGCSGWEIKAARSETNLISPAMFPSCKRQWTWISWLLPWIRILTKNYIKLIELYVRRVWNFQLFNSNHHGFHTMGKCREIFLWINILFSSV